MRRVVITGMGAVSPFGKGTEAMMSGIASGESRVRRMPGWEAYKGLKSLVGAPAEVTDEKLIPRQKRRTMGRMSIFAAQAAGLALADAGITELPERRAGCIVGSTMGSAKSISDVFETMLPAHDISKLNSTMFFQCVAHTAAANVSQYLNLNGLIMDTAAACASALQAIGTGYDMIRIGRQDVLLCGGAEELHPTVTGSFDVLYATSAGYNDSPEATPRPFDRDRDGLVCGEGSGILVLEDYERAVSRGAHIYAEITGYATSGSGSHMSQSDRGSMAYCMSTAMAEAGITAPEVDYVNAHATATLQGDAEEAAAIREVIGDGTPVSSLKGYMGHTLGASGALELIATLEMMRRGVIYPTLNLKNVADDCAGIDHVTARRDATINTILKNCFAFGGINSALVCRKLQPDEER